MVLTACENAKEFTRPPLARDIGEPPAYLQEVPIPYPRPKESPVTDAELARERLREANAIITCAKADWKFAREHLLKADPNAEVQTSQVCEEQEKVKAAKASKRKPAKAKR